MRAVGVKSSSGRPWHTPAGCGNGDTEKGCGGWQMGTLWTHRVWCVDKRWVGTWSVGVLGNRGFGMGPR